MRDFYFAAESDDEALRRCNLPNGPMIGGTLEGIEAKNVMGTALEELVAIATGEENKLTVARTKPLWPEMPTNPADYVPGPFLTRLPDALRDDLAAVEMTPASVTSWSRELFGYSPDMVSDTAMP